MKRNSKYSWLWIAWLVAFLVIEGAALLNPGLGDTLSEQVWWVTQVSFFWFMVAGLMTWLLFHFLGPKARRWLDSWRRK